MSDSADAAGATATASNSSSRGDGAGDEFKLVYTNSRGRAEVIRLLFAAAGVEYEDFRYDIKFWFDAETGLCLDRPKFGPDRDSGKFLYNQIPVLEVNGKQFAQTNAIERYLARRFDLMGSSEEEACEIDGVVHACVDLCSTWWTSMYRGPNKSLDTMSELTHKFIEGSLQPYLNSFSKLIEASGSDFLVGSKLSLADISLNRWIHELRMKDGKFMDEQLEKHPLVRRNYEKTAALAGIAKWRASGPTQESPF